MTTRHKRIRPRSAQVGTARRRKRKRLAGLPRPAEKPARARNRRTGAMPGGIARKLGLARGRRPAVTRPRRSNRYLYYYHLLASKLRQPKGEKPCRSITTRASV